MNTYYLQPASNKSLTTEPEFSALDLAKTIGQETVTQNTVN